MRTLLPLLLAMLVTGPALAPGSASAVLAAEAEPQPEVEPDGKKFVEHQREGGWLTTYHLTLTPKSPTPPVLRYRLLPSLGEMVEGNAATQYHRAILLMQPTLTDNHSELWDSLEAWWEMPLEQLPIEEMERTLERFDGVLREVHLGARRTECDWGLPFQENPGGIFTMNLEEFQQTRNLARLMITRVRLRLAQGRFDEAMEDLKSGTALARHVGTDTFLIGGLVGIAISEIHNIQLLTALTVDDAPNLYWSITNLPQPLVPFRSALEIEREAPSAMFPELVEARTETRDEAYWNQTLIEVLGRLSQYDSAVSVLQKESKSTTEKLETTAVLAYVYMHAPAARKALVEKFDYSPDAVAKMPGSRVLLLYSGHVFETVRDQQFSLYDLPYIEAVKRFEDIEKDPADGVNFTGVFLPGSHHYYTAIVRNQRTFALLRTVEALRDFVATHDRVPESLEEITNLPVPVNPITGQPFGYQVEDAEARKVILATSGEVIHASVGQAVHNPTRLKITFRE